MKKIIGLLAAVALISGCASQPETTNAQDTKEGITLATETIIGEKEANKVSYTLKKDSYVDETDQIHVEYLTMEGYAGELTQDYVNQSFLEIISLYGNDDFYEKVQITPQIWLSTEDRISVVYSGHGTLSRGRETRTGGRTVEFLHPVNIDMTSSNEITFDNLFTDTEAVRKLIGDKVISEGISDSFEAEGIRIYMNDEKVFFAYMPLDDSATEFIKVSLDLSDLDQYMNTDFGPHPAS